MHESMTSAISYLANAFTKNMVTVKFYLANFPPDENMASTISH